MYVTPSPCCRTVRDASKAEELGVPLADLGSLVGQHVQSSSMFSSQRPFGCAVRFGRDMQYASEGLVAWCDRVEDEH